MWYQVIDVYQSGKGYKVISKALGLWRTTVRVVIHKWRKPRWTFPGVVGLPATMLPQKPLTADQKEHNGHKRFTLAKKHLDYPRDFWANKRLNNWWNREFCSLSENPGRGMSSHQFMTLSSYGLCSRPMIWNTSASPPLNGSKQKNIREWPS